MIQISRLIRLALAGLLVGSALAAPSSISLTASPNPARFGALVTLAAAVNPVAQGRVVFYDGVTLLGSANVVQGMATLVVHPANTGIRQILARYIGTPPSPGGVSAVVNLNVTSTPAFNFTPAALAGNTYFYDLAAGDFNRDGNADVIAVSGFDLVVFPGDGAGHFGVPIQTSIASVDLLAPRIAVGDFNGDGSLDVAVATSTVPTEPQSVSVWFGRGDGTFAQGPVFQIPGISMAVADFNGDGFADLAIGYGPTPGVAVLLSNGDGTLQTPISYAVSGDQVHYDMSGGHPPVLLAAADVNQDGAPDLIAVTGVANAAGAFDNRISVLLGNGDGTFLQPTGWVDDQANAQQGIGAVAVGDINGDLAPDLVIQNNEKDVTVMVGNGDGTFQPPDHVTPSASGMSAGVIIADFTGDGKADIAALYTSGLGLLQVFPGNGDGTFQSVSGYDYAVSNMSAFSAADFNGDGRVDIAATGNPESVTILEGMPGAALHVAIAQSGVVTALNSETYTITITNASGATPTTVTVSVTGGLTPSSNGAGWSCAGPIISCTRSDNLPGGSSFPPITVQTQAIPTGNTTQTIEVQVSGGGSPSSEAFESVPEIPCCTPNPALITSVNTVSAAIFAGISPNDWIEIHGINLVPATTPAAGVIWSNAPDFAAGRMPTQLGGVSVSVDGAPAYVYFFCSAATDPACSTDQINVLTPLSLPGIPSITVTSGSGSVSSVPGLYPNVNPVTPSFLRFGASRYVAATHADYSLLGPASLYPGVSTPAMAGEVVLLWVAGFGLPIGPLTAGSSIQSGALPETPVCTVGGHPANVSIALVSPGLYQLNLAVPLAAKSGDNPVTCIYGGAATPDGALLTLQ